MQVQVFSCWHRVVEMNFEVKGTSYLSLSKYLVFIDEFLAPFIPLSSWTNHLLAGTSSSLHFRRLNLLQPHAYLNLDRETSPFMNTSIVPWITTKITHLIQISIVDSTSINEHPLKFKFELFSSSTAVPDHGCPAYYLYILVSIYRWISVLSLL